MSKSLFGILYKSDLVGDAYLFSLFCATMVDSLFSISSDKILQNEALINYLWISLSQQLFNINLS